MQSQSRLTEELNQFIKRRLFRGDEAYLLTLMFKALKGGEESVARQMNKVAEILYSRILTRLVKNPRNTDIEQLPLWLSCPDWPVRKMSGLTAADILMNGGRHLHAMMFVPPNARTGVRLSQLINEKPRQFLVGQALTRLHVEPVEKTPDKATGYVLKSVGRGRVGWGEILILPKSHSEMGRISPRQVRRLEAEDEFRARVAAWSEASS